ncbi:MAG: hypothetical protein ACK4N5_06940 [Myxococcales bacterium]
MTAALSFTDHDGFQKTVLRAGATAALAGIAAHVFGLVGLGAPLEVFACAAAASACGSTVRSRALYGVLGGLAGLLPMLWPQHPLFGLSVAGGSIGALYAHVRRARTQPNSEVGQPRAGWLTVAAAIAIGGAALAVGSFVVKVFDSHQLIDLALPSALAAGARVALLGFFASLGAAGAHLTHEADPVETQYAALLPELAGDLKVLGARAMTNYRRCAEVLASSEPGFARNQLARSLSEVTGRILELARRWQAIDKELGERAESEVALRREELRVLKDRTRDEIARKQLGVAEASLDAELQQLDRIRRGRERVMARLHGEMALLERTRFALLGLKSSDAHLRAAELSAISESLSTIARDMDCEAEAVDQEISRVVEVVTERDATGGGKVRV